MRRAAFLDRDGVLVEDVDLLVRLEQVRVLPGVARAIANLREAGWAIVVVTNQTVVARGLVSERDVDAVNADIARRLTDEDSGAIIDKFYVCPHHPKATLAEYRVECDCRKPRAGMLLRAAEELGIDLSASVLVGDRSSDIAAGRCAGCRTILVETGMHDRPPIESPDAAVAVKPDATCRDLVHAVDHVLGGHS